MKTFRLALPLLLVPPISAQQWSEVSLASMPPPRASTDAAYDPSSGQVLLYGGYDGFARLSDTWQWDGTTWAQRTPANSPGRLCCHAMVFDQSRGRMVLFGGARTLFSWRNETWEWTGSDWSLRTPATSPPGRVSHAMAYDSSRQRTVLFGGTSSSGSLDDTWEYDGTSWTPRSPANKPSPRDTHGMAYDAGRQCVVLFGGFLGSPLGDTWEYDGTNWSQRSPLASPPARYGHRMVYDAARQRVVLFGGYSNSGELGDTWEYDGTTWVQRVTVASPNKRGSYAMAYDTAHAEAVLFGGLATSELSDTWCYRVPDPAPFPSGSEAAESNLSSNVPFGVTRSRMQMLLESGAFAAPRPAYLVGLELRRDAGATALQAGQLDLTILVGHPATGAADMSTTFASNWAGVPTTAFSARYSFPALAPVPAGPAPYAIQVPFQTPVAWQADDLLIELDAANNTGSGPYDIDAVVQPFGNGSTASLGPGCPGSSGTPQFPAPSTSLLLPGGAIQTLLQNATPGLLAVCLLGDSTAMWSGVPLPYTWPGTSCTFYTNQVSGMGRTTTAAGTAQASWPIPTGSFFTGLTLYHQWLVIETPGFNPPVIGTEGRSITIGPTTPITFETVWNTNGSATGTKSTAGHLAPAGRLLLQ